MPIRTKRNLLLYGFLAIEFVLFCIATKLCLILAVAAGAAFVILDQVICRCPYCGKWLGRDIGEHCPHCGERLD